VEMSSKDDSIAFPEECSRCLAYLCPLDAYMFEDWLFICKECFNYVKENNVTKHNDSCDGVESLEDLI